MHAIAVVIGEIGRDGRGEIGPIERSRVLVAAIAVEVECDGENGRGDRGQAQAFVRRAAQR